MKYFSSATAVAMLALSSGASAEVITISGLDIQSVGFNSVAPALLAYDEFDPSLGALDSVDITFSGLISIQSATQVNLVQTSPFTFSPLPYVAPINLTLGFDSVLRGFETGIDSIALLTVVASGNGEMATTLMPFNFSFTIDQDQDYGIPVFADPDGSGSASSMGIDAQLSDFLPENPLATGVPIYTNFTASALPFDPRVTPILTTITGAMNIEYWYTKEIEITAVPVPAAAWLFVSGLLGMIGVARHNKK